jgi:ABC-type branched-subunit amino acid transport system permease subunit
MSDDYITAAHFMSAGAYFAVIACRFLIERSKSKPVEIATIVLALLAAATNVARYFVEGRRGFDIFVPVMWTFCAAISTASLHVSNRTRQLDREMAAWRS